MASASSVVNQTQKPIIMQQSPITRVVQREWRRMTSRRLYFGVCLVLPLFTLFFMATIFGNGQMENIPIGIVDQDNTATSRDITRRMSAVPTFRVGSSLRRRSRSTQSGTAERNIWLPFHSSTL